MAADRSTLLDEAWDRIPSNRVSTPGIGSFTRIRVERIISVAVGLGSLALGLQALFAAYGSTDELEQWRTFITLLAFIPLAAMILACFIGRGVRLSGGIFAIAYVLVLTAWPLAITPVVPEPTAQPWIWFLVNIATLAAMLAFPLPLQIIWTVLVPLLYGTVRVIQGRFDPENLIATGLDVSFALILGGVMLALGWLLRSVAANVDQARARAVSSYAAAAASDAAEHERAEIAALMHDSVLAALIAAERTSTPRERTLATAMARDALTRLANTEQDPREGSDEPCDAATITHDLEAAIRELGASTIVRLKRSADATSAPGRVGRALTLAATQAVANSLQHAGGEGLTVSVTATATDIRITVRDSGAGFDLEGVPNDRLGIKASIVARVAAVGGCATVTSNASGTTVEIAWSEGDV